MHTARRRIIGKRLLAVALALPQTEVCQHRCLPALAYVVGYLCLYGKSSCCRRFISFLLLCSFSISQRPLPTGKGNLVYCALGGVLEGREVVIGIE